MSREEITEKVSEVLVDALGADEDEISLEATLMGDLDAESIDFLDIVFQLEKTFDLKIPRAELFPGPADLGDSESLVEDGELTAEGVAQLRKKLPHANVDKFAEDPKVEHIQELFTVEMIVNYIEGRLS